MKLRAALDQRLLSFSNPLLLTLNLSYNSGVTIGRQNFRNFSTVLPNKLPAAEATLAIRLAVWSFSLAAFISGQSGHCSGGQRLRPRTLVVVLPNQSDE